MNEIKSTIEVSGKKYTLQHPGNREWIRLRSTLFKPQSDQVDMEPLLDYFFEHCVFPESGEKLTLDTVPLRDLQEGWANVALLFLTGELEAGYIYPGKGKTGKK